MKQESGLKNAGTLDPAFHGDGMMEMPTSTTAVAALQDKKLLVATGWLAGSGHTVSRFTDKGAFDQSFGKDGTVVIPDRGAVAMSPSAVIPRSTGGYLISGIQLVRADKLYVFGLLEDGRLDESFGDEGMVTLLASELGADARFVDKDSTIDAQFFSSGWMVVSQLDAKIYLSHSFYTSSGVFKGVVYCLNPDGSRNTSFNGGHVFIESPVAGIALGGLAADRDGVLVGGTLFAPVGTMGDAFVTRYNQNGAIDTSFGNGGKVIIPNGEEGRMSFLSSTVLRADGAILVTGFSNKGEGLITVLNASGSFNLIFNKGRPLYDDFREGLNFAKCVAQPDGRIVVTGWTSDGYLMVSRYQLDGALDPAFGGKGWVLFPSRAEANTRHLGSELTSDNKIVILGHSYHRYAVRYLT